MSTTLSIDNPATGQTITTLPAHSPEQVAELATAEERFTLGNYKEAIIHATRAQERLKPGSPAWLRAEDIVTYKPMKPL